MGVLAWTDHAEAGEDAPNVRVHREERLPEGEEHHDTRCLLSDARRSEQPVHGLVDLEAGEEADVQSSPLLCDPAQDAPDSLCLLPV